MSLEEPPGHHVPCLYLVAFFWCVYNLALGCLHHLRQPVSTWIGTGHVRASSEVNCEKLRKCDSTVMAGRAQWALKKLQMYPLEPCSHPASLWSCPLLLGRGRVLVNSSKLVDQKHSQVLGLILTALRGWRCWLVTANQRLERLFCLTQRHEHPACEHKKNKHI